VKVSEDFPLDLDVTRTPTAYGDRALPRMNSELKSADSKVRQRALVSMCDYLRDPEHISVAIKLGTVEILRDLLFDSDNIVRQKTSECLFILSGHAIGREALVSRHVIGPMSSLFQDPSVAVRRNVHATLARAAQSPLVAEEIVEQQLIAMLINKVTSETDDIIELILDTLHFCFKVDTQSALNCHAMHEITQLLHSTRDKIRAYAARAIMGLTVTLSGKQQAVEDQSVDALVPLLSDESTAVRAYSAGALMNITVTTQGKYTALENDAVMPLLKLVRDETSEVRLYSLKTLTCLSEAPEGRHALLECETEIRAVLHDPIPAVAAAADTALKVILWKP